MTLRKRTTERVSHDDDYYVVYENDSHVYIIDDSVAFKIEADAKDSDRLATSIVNAADVVIEKKTRRVIKSRWF
jgi:hypothetical protein